MKQTQLQKFKSVLSWIASCYLPIQLLNLEANVLPWFYTCKALFRALVNRIQVQRVEILLKGLEWGDDVQAGEEDPNDLKLA